LTKCKNIKIKIKCSFLIASLIFQIAGTMSELGRDKSSILSTLNLVKSNLSTFGIALTPCSIPGSRPTFSLADDEMELGLGVHGEAGIGRVKVRPKNNFLSPQFNL
jgi:dihydroxyacetone kinase